MSGADKKSGPSVEELRDYLETDDGKLLRVPNCETPGTFPVRRRIDKGGPEMAPEDRHYLTEYRAHAPCGKCQWCKRNLKNEWYGRVMAEFHSYRADREHSILHLTLSPDGMSQAGLDFRDIWLETSKVRAAYEKLRELFNENTAVDGLEEGIPQWVYNHPGLFPDKDREDERYRHIVNWWRRNSRPIRERMANAILYDIDEFEGYIHNYRTLNQFRSEGRKEVIHQFINFLDRLRHASKRYIDKERERLQNIETGEVRQYLAFLDTIYNKHPRYFMASEYGDTTGRLHYHAIFFAWLACIGDKTITKIVNGKTVTECHCDICTMVNKAWGLGFTLIEPVGDLEASSAYVTKYVMKASLNDDLVPHYFPAPAYTASRKPPLGEAVVLSAAQAILNSGVSVKYTYDAMLNNGLWVKGKQYNLGRNALRRMRKILEVEPGFSDAVKHDTAKMGAIAVSADPLLPGLASLRHGKKRVKIQRQISKDEYNKMRKVTLRSYKLKGGP